MKNLSIIERLPQIVKNGREKANDILNKTYIDTIIQKEVIISDSKNKEYKDKWINQFYQGDNLTVIEKLLKKGYAGKIDLIYIDPPFLTQYKL